MCLEPLLSLMYMSACAKTNKIHKNKKNVKLYRVFSSHENILRILNQKPNSIK